MVFRVATILLLAVVSQTSALLGQEQQLNAATPKGPQIGKLNETLSSSGADSRPLSKQSPPYARVDQEAGGAIKDVILSWTLNHTSESDQINLNNDKKQQWTLRRLNGSTPEERVNVDLDKLLEALNSSNLSSEVQFDDSSPGLVNITISSWRGNDQARELSLLEDLLDESKFDPSMNLTAEMRNNHRLLARHPVRSKPVEVSLVVSSMTVPPIRRTQDVIAENYTIKKIATEANIFALKLLKQVNMEHLGADNVINSPFAIYQGLGLLMAGSMGDTTKELDKLLLGVHSVYENTKLTHDQDRSRLMASFGDVLNQLQLSATNHFLQESDLNDETDCRAERLSLKCRHFSQALDRIQYRGGSEEQHFIVANNLLFSPSVYEISSEFKAVLGAYHNNTALTKMEVGSTESIQVVNGWIRQSTAGMIPAIMGKRNTFDEFNVMTLLSTSWLAQEWRSSFRRVASPLRSSIRLKGQSAIRGGRKLLLQLAVPDEPLMEFVDDQKGSHFVEYIKSEPTRLIHNYHTYLNRQLVDVVVVPFRNSNQRLLALTPMPMAADAYRAKNLPLNITAESFPADPRDDSSRQQIPAESSLLTKMINSLASEPRNTMRQLWATIAPEIITKQTIESMQSPINNQRNSTNENRNLPIPPLVKLSMPVLRLEADSSLSASLNHVGLVNAFDSSQANFIGINGHPFNNNKLHLSNVVYKTTFNLNEHGINYDRTVKSLESMRILPQRQQAQEQTEVRDRFEPGELVNEVSLNKPFMLMVVDFKTKLVLYTGTVRNPAK